MNIKHDLTQKTYWVRLYLSGPIEVAKQIIREHCMNRPVCVNVSPTLFQYTGGEEQGYVVEFVQYLRFPVDELLIMDTAVALAEKLVDGTHQWSVMIMDPTETRWLSGREDK